MASLRRRTITGAICHWEGRRPDVADLSDRPHTDEPPVGGGGGAEVRGAASERHLGERISVVASEEGPPGRGLDRDRPHSWASVTDHLYVRASHSVDQPSVGL